MNLSVSVDLANPESPDAQNPQLKQPPLEIDMDPSKIISSKLKSPQALEKIQANCLIKIKEMYDNVKTNDRLQKYFVQAGTNSGQILLALNNLMKDLTIMKQKFYLKDTNLRVISDVLAYLEQILYRNDLNTLKNIEKAIWIVEFESKVICSMELIMNSFNLPYDITTVDKEHFPHVWQHIHSKKLGNEHKIKAGLDDMKNLMTIVTSACLDEEKCENALTKFLTFGISYPQYYFSDKEGQLKSMVFYRKPTIHRAQNIWNLSENGMTRELSKLGLEKIVTNTKIYIPIDEKREPKDLRVEESESIQVRILHDDEIFFKTKKKAKSGFCSSNYIEIGRDIDTIILHMHGGGFFALSSRSMQVYTRRWAIELKVPVLSIDYRMPPEHRFPTAPMDCLKVYRFVTHQLHKYCNIRPRKIIIAGDSAGGNLSFALTGLILKEKLPTPYGIFTAYPACDLQKKMNPSKLFAFTDPILSPSMLLLCLSEYLNGNVQYETDPIASPIFLTQEFIGGKIGDKRFPRNWPRTIIQVGTEDPLYDDSIKMMERMVASNVKCECQVYQNISHGFLTLEFMVPECLVAIKDSVQLLAKLLK